MISAYLGTGAVNALWASDWGRIDPHGVVGPASLFVARRQLVKWARYQRARRPWAVDSSAYTEITKYGTWRIGPREYVRLVRRWDEEIGNLEWAAPRDWPCEDAALRASGRTVAEHQRLTTLDFLQLWDAWPDDAGSFPFMPALQGREPDDYVRHRELYARMGVDLDDYPMVGVGSLCRRTSRPDIRALVRRLHAEGLRMHLFGVKTEDLAYLAPYAESADSHAWSLGARHWVGLCRHPGSGTRWEQNCMVYAHEWFDEHMARYVDPRGVSYEAAPARPALPWSRGTLGQRDRRAELDRCAS